MATYKFDNLKLTYKTYKVRTFKWLATFNGLIIVCLSVLLVLESSKLPTIKVVRTKPIIKEVNSFGEFSKQRFKKLIKELHMSFPEVVYAQAELESNNFTSEAFFRCNNMFGLKPSHQRPSTRLDGKKDTYAVFSYWQLAVIDYALLQAKYLSRCKTQEEYLEKLGSFYAEDSNYIDKIKSKLK